MIKPRITEKNVERAGRGYYTFEVPLFSTRGQVKEELEKLFPVVVGQLWFLSHGGEKPSSKQRTHRQRRRTRLAIATLKSGAIDVFGNAAKKERSEKK